MRIRDLPTRVQLAIQAALDELPEDCFAQTVEREGSQLVVGVTAPGSREVSSYRQLRFDQERERYVVIEDC